MNLGQLVYNDQENWKSIDPNAKESFDLESAPDTRVNRNGLEHHESRPATDFLRDLIQSYVQLELLPGPIQERTYEFHHKKRIFQEHGWPHNFDVSGFDAAMKAFEEQESSDINAEMPLMSVNLSSARLEHIDADDKQAKTETEEALAVAKEEVTLIPEDVMKRKDEREQNYPSDPIVHPFFN